MAQEQQPERQQALPLEVDRRTEWRLDERTRATGLQGVDRARAALQEALRERTAA
jgi:hypothetical protein